MVYGLWFIFGVIWSGGMYQERVAISSEELMKCYLW